MVATVSLFVHLRERPVFNKPCGGCQCPHSARQCSALCHQVRLSTLFCAAHTVSSHVPLPTSRGRPVFGHPYYICFGSPVRSAAISPLVFAPCTRAVSTAAIVQLLDFILYCRIARAAHALLYSFRSGSNFAAGFLQTCQPAGWFHPAVVTLAPGQW